MKTSLYNFKKCVINLDKRLLITLGLYLSAYHFYILLGLIRRQMSPQKTKLIIYS